MIRRLSRLPAADALALSSLCALAFPALLMVRLDDRILFAHYLVLALAIPVLFALRPSTLAPVVPVLGMILLSSVINMEVVSVYTAVFHSLNLIALALLASCSGWLALRFAKMVIMIYAVTILLTQALVFVGLEELVSWLLVTKDGLAASRVAAFATEPSFAGMILLILGRFVIIFDNNWMTPYRLGLILAAMMATLSLFGLITAILLLAMYLLERGATRALLGIVVGGLVLLGALSVTDFFINRFGSMDLSQGLWGLRTGTIRLLPYLYMSDILVENPWPLLWGAGANQLEPAFFQELGQFYTMHDKLPVHMAGPIYDYGLPAILPILFLWNRPKGFAARALFLVMTLTVMLNTGIGTYLFILFGTFALLEQRLRTA